jgi:hypothetical protein
MRLGAVFPHHEISNDPTQIRDWAQAKATVQRRTSIGYSARFEPAGGSRPCVKWLPRLDGIGGTYWR